MTFDDPNGTGWRGGANCFAIPPVAIEMLHAEAKRADDRLQAGGALAFAGLAELARLARAPDATEELRHALAATLSRIDEALAAATRAVHAPADTASD